MSTPSFEKLRGTVAAQRHNMVMSTKACAFELSVATGSLVMSTIDDVNKISRVLSFAIGVPTLVVGIWNGIEAIQAGQQVAAKEAVLDAERLRAEAASCQMPPSYSERN